MRNLNPPRVVATWAIENYWAEEYALARALVDKIVADAKRALDAIPDRVPSDDGKLLDEGVLLGGEAGAARRAAIAAAFWQRYADERCSRLSPHVLR